MKLIIKGACYFKGDELLIPHYTGEYNMVACDRYLTVEGLKEYDYDDDYIKKVIDNEDYIEYLGIKYYNGERGLEGTDGMELESDLSNIEHNRGEF